MADFSKSGCCDCRESKSCPDAFTNFAADLCPKVNEKNSKDAKCKDC